MAAIIALASPSPGRAVVGGNPAAAGEFPFAAALREKHRFICSGSVIAPSLVLTAAHCARQRGHRRLRVVTGRRHLHANDTGQVLRAAAVERFPKYRRNQRHDLALIHLAQPTTAPPVRLAGPAEANMLTPPGTSLFIAGYGDRRPLYSEPARFGRLTVGREQIRPYRRCRQEFGRRDFRASTMYCALGRAFGPKGVRTTSCPGDSGGPLLASTPSGFVQLGVASYGGPGVRNIYCGAPGIPSVYARATTGIAFLAKRITAASGAQ